MRAAVVGTFAWDLIRDRSGEVLFQGPGGLMHCVAALSSLLPEETSIVPISRVDRDSCAELQEILSGLRGVRCEGIVPVRSGRYQVELRYHGAGNRCERACSLPSPLDIEEILRLAAGATGLLFNFISGEDAPPDSLPRLRKSVLGPLIVDLHSLTLNRDDRGHRSRRRALPGWRSFLEGVDVLQVNEEEARVLAGRGGDPIPAPADELERIACEVHAAGIGALVVTLGERGSIVFEASAAPQSIAPVLTGEALDPTGCGDVHGAALLAGLMRGFSIEASARLAGHAAAAQCGIAGWPKGLPSFDLLAARACI
ncbi:MAG: hypothetical protein CME06_01325 [Gemmatimonadetes bacterium]|nr:hypothetical protein [Gemmatimonadota bacterium]